LHQGGLPGYNQGQNFSQAQGWRFQPENNFNKDQGGPSIRPPNQGLNQYERTAKLEDTDSVYVGFFVKLQKH